MKPSAFEYVVPSTVDEAIVELSRYEGEATLLSGGQSLVPLLNFRLATPAVIVDLGGISALVGVSIDVSSIVIGAMTPVARLLETDVKTASPVLAAAARLVGHPQIRSRGTVGGSLAHADPAAELPAVALLTGASVQLDGPNGKRSLPTDAFFTGIFTTAREWNEIVVGVVFPKLNPVTGWGFREFARRPGDFALAGIGTLLTLEHGVIASIRIVAFGVGPTPIRALSAESVLLGQTPTAAAIGNAREALTTEIRPGDSINGSGQYIRHVAGVLLERAVGDALQTAESRKEEPK